MSICQNQDLLDSDQQLAGEHPEAAEEHIKAEMLKLHTCCPAVVVSFDPDAQTVKARPVTQCVWVTLPGTPEGTKGVLTMPLCVDVPVIWVGGSGWFLTFPPQAGDECLLFFSERCIDGWFQNGPAPIPPARYRTHDLADAFALVGVNSQPNVLQNFFTGGPHLRSRGNDTYLAMSDGQIDILADVDINGNLKVEADEQVVGSMDIGQDTSIGGDAVVDGNLHVLGDLWVDGTGGGGGGGGGGAPLVDGEPWV